MRDVKLNEKEGSVAQLSTNEEDIEIQEVAGIPPLRTICSEKWNDAGKIEGAIFSPKKLLIGIPNKEERGAVQELIKSYEAGGKELEINLNTQEATSMGSIDMNEDENMTEDERMREVEENWERYDWNNLVFLNHTLKNYEVEQYQNRNISSKVQEHLKEMVESIKRRLDDLLKMETTKQRLKSEPLKGKVDYDLLNKASNIVMSFSEGWDNLSFVDEMILGLQLEITKEEDEIKKKNIELISDMYFYPKENAD